MKLLHVLRRPRWLVVIGCAAVLAPAAVLVSGVAATDDVATSQATPLVDRDYIYGQLFDMAYNDVYRVSGADGPPTDPSSPWNEPATVNGWQEFFQHWKQQLTDKTVMTNMAKFATVQDHYFHRLPEQRTNPNYSFNPNYPWDSDDAEVTVPGATCPGQRVLLAAHPDGTPVSPTIVGEVNNPTGSTSGVNGFGAGRRTLTLSNIANGGAYDDTSGVTMTMGEYQALLRWYSINGTYPSKTLKIALLDASAGRAADGTYLREGAKYYANNLIPQGPQGQYAMFAEMNANGMSYPAYHLGTQYFWNNLANGGVGPWRTFVTDTPSAPNSFYPDTGGQHRGQQRRDHAVPGEPAERGHGRLRPAEREVRRHGSAGEPAALQPTDRLRRLNCRAVADARRPGLHAGRAGAVLAGAPGRDGAGGHGVVHAGRGLDLLEPRHPGLQRRRRPGLEHRREPVPLDGQRRDPLDAGAGLHGRRDGLRARQRRAGGRDDHHGGRERGGRHQRQGRRRRRTWSRASRSSSTSARTSRPARSRRSAPPAPTGTGVTLTAPLRLAHASGVRFHVNQGQPIGFTGDTLEHLNFFAAGAPHGLDGETSPTEELLRALELPSQYTALLASGNDYLGAVPAPTGTIAYFETNPVKPTSTKTVTFDASFARTLDGGKAGLQYYWDFGDGTSGTGETVTHTYASAQWADVKLVVVKGDQTKWGMYRQAVAVNSPSGAAPATPACGTFSTAERNALIAAAKAVFRVKTTALPSDVAKEGDRS